jgi:hypothetical protein
MDMDGLSIYEKKSLLIQRELDNMGMGRYQWYIWSLCGLGYFLDLLWAQAFGLIATPLQKELGFSGEFKSLNLYRRSRRELKVCRWPAWEYFHGIQLRSYSGSFYLGCIGGYHWYDTLRQLSLHR